MKIQFLIPLLLLNLPASAQSPPPCQTKTIIHAAEAIVLLSSPPTRLMARIDSGATLSSIDADLALKLGFHRAIGQVSISNAHGTRQRKVIRIAFLLRGQKREADFTLAPRTHLEYQVLLGRASLKGFLIDPEMPL